MYKQVIGDAVPRMRERGGPYRCGRAVRAPRAARQRRRTTGRKNAKTAETQRSFAPLRGHQRHSAESTSQSTGEQGAFVLGRDFAFLSPCG